MPPLPRQGAINAHLLSHVQVGDELDVWWPLDKVYYPGVVGALEADGRHRIDYTDGDVELVYLTKERWKFRGKSADRVMRALINPSRHTAPPPPQSTTQPHHHQQPQHHQHHTRDDQIDDHHTPHQEPHGAHKDDDDDAALPAPDDAEQRRGDMDHVEQRQIGRAQPDQPDAAENGQVAAAEDTTARTTAKSRWRKAKGRGRGAIVK